LLFIKKLHMYKTHPGGVIDPEKRFTTHCRKCLNPEIQLFV